MAEVSFVVDVDDDIITAVCHGFGGFREAGEVGVWMVIR